MSVAMTTSTSTELDAHAPLDPGGLTGAELFERLRHEPMLLTLPQAATRLGVSVRTVKRRIADGSITEFRSGPRPRDRRVTLAALVEFVQSRQVSRP